LAGINPSDIVYKKALEATINSVKRGVESERAINAGINVIRGTSWFQTKNYTEQREIETSFRESMQKEFGLEVKPKSTPAPKPTVNDNLANTRTEVIDRSSIPTAPIKPKTEKPAEKAKPKPTVQNRPAAKSTPPRTEVPKRQAKPEARPIEPIKAPKKAPVLPSRQKKRRGMGLGSFIVSLFFVGFLAWVSWLLYYHEINVSNIVIYENDELVFKEAFPKQSVSVLGQDLSLPHAISRKTDPIKIYRPKSGFPFFELSQEVPCKSCDYWTNVQNYDLHHYPDSK